MASGSRGTDVTIFVTVWAALIGVNLASASIKGNLNWPTFGLALVFTAVVAGFLTSFIQSKRRP